MLDEAPTFSRGAVLHQSPRRRERRLGTPSASPAVTPAASPERRRRNDAPAQREHGWSRARGAPAAINVAGTHYRAERGQQFTVGNVSNGLIYLRPVIRPANEFRKRQQDFALLSTTPPNSGEEIEERRRERAPAELFQAYNGTGQASPPRTPTLNPAVERSRENLPYIKSSPPVPRARHQRSRSYSTVDDHFHGIGCVAGTNLQVLIDQCDGPAVDGSRPHTAGPQRSFQSLDVPIPHYNLGSPRFSPGGTPFLYGSSSIHLASTTGEMGSSHTSQQADGRRLWPSVDPRSLPSISSSPVPQGLLRMASQPSMAQVLAPSPLAPSATMTTIPVIPSPPIPSTNIPASISPQIYDRLSFPPSSEDPTIVRYDSSREISAAIPARIIAQITSAAFVDYHLLSDFFLTYRLFMNARDLAAHLIARLRWAIDRGDDTGKVVRVRTFVAIRHWLLNYFADDFVPSLLFRQEFVKIMNDLTHFVQANGNASDLKIIGELKKCWRRTCALYWDSSENAEASVDEDIMPGGPPGTREEALSRPESTMFRVQQFTTPPPRLDLAQPDHSSGTESFIRDVVQPRAVTMFERREGNQYNGATPLSQSQSHSNIRSRSSGSAQTELETQRYPGMRKASSSHNLSPKKLQSGPHKRSGSFSDALRDTRYPLPLPISIAKSTQLLMALPYAGSLVRGNLFPPTPAFVEVIAPSTPVNEHASLNFGTQTNASSNSSAMRLPGKHLAVPNKAYNGPGVKKLFGSMRKALVGKLPTHPATSRNAVPSGIPTTGVVRSSTIRSNMSTIEALTANASRLGMGTSGDGKVARVDLLGAGAVDAFQRAMTMIDGNLHMDQERLEDTGTFTSGDEVSRDGETMDVGRMDGARDDDGRTDLMAEAGSAMSDLEPHAISTGNDFEGRSYLDSSSTFNPLSDFDPAGALGGISFLADESEPSGSSRDSVQRLEPVEEVPGIPSLSPPPPLPISVKQSTLTRRSKSFSFERLPPMFSRIIGNIDERSSVTHPGGVDVRSLHSARSFSINRGNSLLSQFSSTMDNISEFSEFRASERFLEGQAAHKGLLRRRPGGNLRAAATIGELEQPRPMSTGSIHTGPFSLEDDLNSELQMRPRQRPFSPVERFSIASSGPQRIAPGVVSLGAMGKPMDAPRSPTPVLEEAPHEPVDPETTSECTRISFEEGVQMLRDLPDDEDDDGGVEVALAKLEGTYQRKKSGDSSPNFDFRRSIARLESRDYAVINEEDEDDAAGYDGVGDDVEGEENHKQSKRRHKQVLDQAPLGTPPIRDGNSDRLGELALDEPDYPLPRRERGFSSNAFGGRASNIAAPRARATASGSAAMSRPSAGLGIDLDRVDSRLETHLGNNNFDDDNASELSSELSFKDNQPSTNDGGTFNHPLSTGTIIAELGIQSHPLRHPPSPPLTLEQALSMRTKSSGDSPKTPRNASRSLSGKDSLSPQSHRTQRPLRPDTPRRSRESEIFEPTSIHLPFILAYDSELLAKQFTLIEKDALLEVDWKELVELSWSQADTDVKDWVELLNSRDIKGVEVVIARFNLMCRWARSEIIMTKSMDERARTIVKLIHIAAHARQMQNYATMYQITIALLTADIARLRKTWELVSPAEMHTFRELEALVQPVRNFHNLRAEMEKVTGESGCIPFVGLFTHDLILNAQRPPVIHFAQPGSQPLVNFERHRMTAAIVKRLLRLVEASHKYSFVAVDGVCERCLWISALSDDEIRGLSKGIEP